MIIFALLAAIVAVPETYAGSDSVRENRKMTFEFMAAMQSNPKIVEGSKLGRRRMNIEERQRKLRDNIMKKARKLSYSQGGSQQNGGQATGWQSEYQYQNSYQEEGDYNDEGGYSNGQWNGQGVNGKYLNNKGYDSSNFEGADGNWGGNWASEYNGDFDMSSRSFKYAGCASIKSFDEYYAMQSRTLDPFKTQTYVTFRLCPTDSCNKYSLMGCSKNYGEYVVEMESYLESIMEYYSQRYEEYCEYCITCDEEVQLEATEVLQQCYFEKTMEEINEKSSNSYWNSNGNSENNYDGTYNNGNGLSSSAYYTSGGNNRKLYYDYNNANQGQYDNSGSTYSQSKNDGNGYWSNGDYAEGYWKDGLFYQYDETIEAAIKKCKKQQYEQGNYQDYDCSYLNDCDEQVQEDYPPCDADVCGDYSKYCTELHGNVKNQTSSSHTDFMSCTPFESFSFVKEKNVQTVENGEEEYVSYKYKRYAYYDEEQQGVMFYIGPHCSDDHYHLTLGVFSDENCADYIGDQVSVSKVLGFDFDDTNIFQLPEECLACDGMADGGNNQGSGGYNDDNFASQQNGYNKYYNADGTVSYQYSNQYAQYNGDGGETSSSNGDYYSTYVQAPDTDEDGIVAMCSTLYSSSAQCNRNLKSYSTYSQYMTRYELDIEARYCTFIDNINAGTFDSEGHIITDANIFNANTWRRQKYGSRMTVGQGVLLTFSVLLCASLVTVIVYFHKLIRTRRVSPWKPQKEINLEGMTIVGPPIGAQIGQMGGSPTSYGGGNAPLMY